MPEVVYRGNKRQLTLLDGTRLAKHRRAYITPQQFDMIESEDLQKVAITKEDKLEPQSRAPLRAASPPVQTQLESAPEEGEKVTDGSS